jgi:hypothetical protein
MPPSVGLAPWLSVSCLLLASGPGCDGGGTEDPPQPRREAPAEGPAAASPGSPSPAASPGVASLPSSVPTTEGLTAGATPFPYPETPPVQATRDILERVVRTHALEAADAWALGHGLLALGPDATLPGGEPVVEHLFQDFAERRDGWVRFPESRGAVRVEPQRDLMLKVFAEIGVAPERTVVVDGAPATLADLYRGALARSWIEGSRSAYGDWNAVGWSLQALAAWAPPDLGWTAEGGRETRLSALAVAALDALRDETAILRRARAEGQRPSRGALGRAGQLGIIRYACGGAHFLQGVAYAAGRGFVPEARLGELDEEASIALWRLSWEIPDLDGLIASEAELRPFLLVQRLKFLGHLLETVHKLAILDLFHPTEEEQASMTATLEELVRTAITLQAMGWFDGLGAFRREPLPRFPDMATNEQVYLDTVGDASHALRGLDLATGRGRLLH